jgi:hypothetical protein
VEVGGPNREFPGKDLSNFTPHSFVFDGVECASMEGLLQAFKYEDVDTQIEVCKLTGVTAQRRGQERNDVWKSCQTLWWRGAAFDRHSNEYQELLDRAFDALAQNEHFQLALLASRDETLTHSVGKSDPSDTILTEEEFCSRLIRIRSRLKRST